MKTKIVYGLLLLVGILVTGCMSEMPVPANLDTSTTRVTENGLYKMTIKPDAAPIAINEIHTWTLHVETPDAKPVENAVITMGGGMPQHGHGLPTEPKVTKYLGDGNYQVEGVKFQMTGWWEVKFNVTAEGKADNVTFNLILS